MAFGFGVFQNADGYRYEGEWKEDKLNGKGKETWQSNGSSYEGDFVANIKEGEGKFVWQDGSYYKGGFVEG